MPGADPALVGWWARLLDQEEPGRPQTRTLAGVLSDEFPAHTVVDLPGARRPSAWVVAVRTDTATGRVLTVDVRLPEAPLLWYVEVGEPGADPPATTLVAFSDPRYPDGTVLDETEARAAGVLGESQVAALRWWPHLGLVNQIYVASAHRRRGIGGKLGHAAFAVQKARRLPDLHADGRRTDLGERFREGLPGYAAWRLAPRTRRLPPMDAREAEPA